MADGSASPTLSGVIGDFGMTEVTAVPGTGDDLYPSTEIFQLRFDDEEDGWDSGEGSDKWDDEDEEWEEEEEDDDDWDDDDDDDWDDDEDEWEDGDDEGDEDF